MGTLAVDKPTEAIAGLLKERLKYEQWLAALETRRPTTSPVVYSRVRADYEARLSRVLDEIAGRSTELRALIDSLAGQVAGLQDEEATKRDLQSEAELRAAVGEYSTEQWRQFSQAGQAEIARIMARRADAATELAQVQQLLTMASGRRSPAAPAAPPARENAIAGAPSAAASVAAAPPPPVAEDRGVKPTSFDELAFLHSVVEPKADAARAVPAPAPTQAKAAPAVAQPPAAPAQAPPAPPPPPRAVLVESGAPTAQAASVAPGDAEEVVADPEVAVPSFLRDVPLEQVKTLKCAECGTMNFATEWYCERCGGELAAM